MSLAATTRRVLLLASLGLAVASPTRAQVYTVLYTFQGKSDGALPLAGLIQDPAGNLYGTTAGDFYKNPQTGTTEGSIFELKSDGKFALLHNFGAGGPGGASLTGGLVRDSAGNLYGAAYEGGTSDTACFSAGCGVVFKLDTKAEFSVLHSFSGNADCRDGCQPLSPLNLDAAGNLYGATYIGGSRNCNLGRREFGQNSDCGVVFKLDATGKETVLRSFGNGRKDGDNPNPGLFMDAAGNLYGTTYGGGPVGHDYPGAGTVFKLDTEGNETVVHFFSWFVDGAEPAAGLIQDASGNFYGTTDWTFTHVFKLDPLGNVTLLGVGGYSLGPLVMDSVGNLYGTSADGGSNPACTVDGGCGFVYKLDPLGEETVLYSFGGGSDGYYHYGGVIIDASGNLYGTAAYGGATSKVCPSGCGAVFKITP